VRRSALKQKQHRSDNYNYALDSLGGASFENPRTPEMHGIFEALCAVGTVVEQQWATEREIDVLLATRHMVAPARSVRGFRPVQGPRLDAPPDALTRRLDLQFAGRGGHLPSSNAAPA